MNFCGILMTLLAFFLVGCQKENSVSTTPTQVVAQPIYPTKAQPKLPTVKLWIGAEEIDAEMALSDKQIQTGMMFRTNVAENAGMIFVFSFPRRVAFWMKNCPTPLSAAYIDPEGKILEIVELEPHNTNSVVAASDDVQFVLETSRSWFDRHNISPGTVVRTERGTLRETFFRGRQ